jgi:hypothetical protein
VRQPLQQEPSAAAPPPAATPSPAAAADVVPDDEQPRRALYPRLLGLRHLRLRAWQRGLFAEGTLVVAVLLVLADLVSAWTLVVLPLAVALLVKAHDVLAGLLRPTRPAPSPPQRRGAG